jgi:hypothetical protein
MKRPALPSPTPDWWVAPTVSYPNNNGVITVDSKDGSITVKIGNDSYTI